MYADKQYYGAVAEDVYDTNMKLWKVVWTASAPANLDTYGPQVGFGCVVETDFDTLIWPTLE
jgi:hypothetical protein